MKHCLIFSREIFYVPIVLCLNILWLKAVNEITARQTWTGLCKHDVIKVCSIEYLITHIELVLPTFYQLLDRSQNYRIFNVMAIVQPLTYHSTTAYFLAHPLGYSFRGHWITLVFNTQLPQVSTGNSQTSNILLRDNVSVITRPSFSLKN